MHWIDNADSWICPKCGFETSCPAKYPGCICPKCGFQDPKDKEEEKTMEAVREKTREELLNDLNREREKIKKLIDKNNALEAEKAEILAEARALKKELDHYAIKSSEIDMLKECIIRITLDRYGVR